MCLPRRRLPVRLRHGGVTSALLSARACAGLPDMVTGPGPGCGRDEEPGTLFGLPDINSAGRPPPTGASLSWLD